MIECLLFSLYCTEYKNHMIFTVSKQCFTGICVTMLQSFLWTFCKVLTTRNKQFFFQSGETSNQIARLQQNNTEIVSFDTLQHSSHIFITASFPYVNCLRAKLHSLRTKSVEFREHAVKRFLRIFLLSPVVYRTYAEWKKNVMNY